MTDRDVMRRRVEARFNAPFMPLTMSNQNASAEERSVFALEYIAAQLGAIRQNMAPAASSDELE